MKATAPSKTCSADEAVRSVADGTLLVVGGTGAVLEPDMLLEALERRFLTTGHPRDLTLFSPMLPGDRPGDGGLNALAHQGMLARIIGSSFNRSRHPRLIEMMVEGACEAYAVGMGAMVQMLSAAGARQPGIFTRAGLGSFLDPRMEGGRLNRRSDNPPVRIEKIDGEEYLYYPAPCVDVAFIRGTTADPRGYVSLEEEPNTLAMREIALAAHSSGGRTIAQVKRMARAGSLDPKLVQVPGPLVDNIVVHPGQTQLSPLMSDPLRGWNPFMTGALRAPLDEIPPLEDGPVRYLLRRAAMALQPGDVVNLGVGTPTYMPQILLEEDLLEQVTLTNEHGVFGGVMATAIGGSFVPALNPDAIMDSAFQFAFYDGGGLDIAFLGMGEVDADGNVNVSRFGKELNASGGFNNIIERVDRIVFCGTLTSGRLELAYRNGQLSVVREGVHKKFLPRVEQLTFCAGRALRKGQSVLYVTERAVFRLDEEGLVLAEIGPGVDIGRDIAPAVAFPLRVAQDLKVMDRTIFEEGRLALKPAGLEPAALPADVRPGQVEETSERGSGAVAATLQEGG